MVRLLKYEIGIIRWIDRIENNILSMGFEGGFTSSNGANMYELFNIVLDELGVPVDSDGYPGRDAYNNLYFQTWTNQLFDTIPDKIVSKLLTDIIKELNKKVKRKKNER